LFLLDRFYQLKFDGPEKLASTAYGSVFHVSINSNRKPQTANGILLFCYRQIITTGFMFFKVHCQRLSWIVVGKLPFALPFAELSIMIPSCREVEI
jgi:hypothetical protein